MCSSTRRSMRSTPPAPGSSPGAVASLPTAGCAQRLTEEAERRGMGFYVPSPGAVHRQRGDGGGGGCREDEPRRRARFARQRRRSRNATGRMNTAVRLGRIRGVEVIADISVFVRCRITRLAPGAQPRSRIRRRHGGKPARCGRGGVLHRNAAPPRGITHLGRGKSRPRTAQDPVADLWRLLGHRRPRREPGKRVLGRHGRPDRFPSSPVPRCGASRGYRDGATRSLTPLRLIAIVNVLIGAFNVLPGLTPSTAGAPSGRWYGTSTTIGCVPPGSPPSPVGCSALGLRSSGSSCSLAPGRPRRVRVDAARLVPLPAAPPPQGSESS